MEEKSDNLIAMVKSPSKDAHIRKGSGFSLAEINAAGKTIIELKKLKIRIDYFRRSALPENIEVLKKLKTSSKKRKKRAPFEPKTKKVRVRTKKVREKAVTKEKVVEKPKKPEPEVKVKAPKVKAKVPKKAKAKVEAQGTPLTELSGLGAATAKKFIELGVSTVEDLIKEDAAELGTLIKGASEERISKWIEEGKSILG